MVAIAIPTVTSWAADRPSRMPRRVSRENFTGTNSEPVASGSWLLFLLRRLKPAAPSQHSPAVADCQLGAGSAPARTATPAHPHPARTTPVAVSVRCWEGWAPHWQEIGRARV